MKRPNQTKTNTKIKVKDLKKKVKSVNWEGLANEIFKESRKPRVHRNFQLVMTLLMVFISAKIVSSFINGDSLSNVSSSSPVVIDEDNVFTNDKLNQIKTAKVFKTNKVIVETTPGKKQIDVVTKCTKADTKSSLPIKLMHTVVLQDSVKSIASVSVRSGSKLQKLREGDKINSMAKIDKIERLNLIIKNLQTGGCESIPSSLDKGMTKRPPNIGVLSSKASKKYKKEIKKL